MPLILTPDLSLTLAQSLVFHGRTLDVVRAVTKNEAGEKARENADKWNMYLLRGGTFYQSVFFYSIICFVDCNTIGSDLPQFTSSPDPALLRSNPSLFISKMQLSVRQIPTFVTERMIKRLTIHALRRFEGEVRKGERWALSADELAMDGGRVDDA